jgi:hypothetical protein
VASLPIISFISVVPIILAAFAGLRANRRTNILAILYFVATCLLFSASIIMNGISEVLGDVSIVKTYAPITGSLSAVTIVLHADAVSRDTVDPIKLVIVSVLATGATLFQNLGFLVLLQMVSLVVWIYYAAKIHVNAPTKITRFSRLNLIGVLLFAAGSLWGSFGMVIPYLVAPPQLMLDMINLIRWEVILGISFVLIAFAYAKAPNLANILPFIALRLCVVDTRAGIALFNHDWIKRADLMHEDLFSSMLSGISMILNECVKKGDIREIHLDKARMLLNKSEEYPVAFVLVTSRTTKALRNALDTFASRFIARFANVLGKELETSKFLPANEIVEECFSFAVEYTAGDK